MSSPQPPEGRPMHLPDQGGPRYPSSPGMQPVPAAPLAYPEPVPAGPPPSADATGPLGTVPPAVAPSPGSLAPRPQPRRHSRIGAAWVALIVAVVVLVFLLIFVVQNSGPVQVKYLGFEGTMSLGVAMMFAAAAGALTVGLLGTVRILQLRTRARRIAAGTPPAGPAR